MQSKLVSIIIPVYNGENYLKEAIEVALNQTYKNTEILVIDDGSTDGTKKIMLEYRDKIRCFHKENGGVSSALNLAIKNMRGDWFSWLSHDDLWSHNKLERQIDFLKKHPDVDICYTGDARIDMNGNIIPGGSNGQYYSDNAKALRKLIESDYINGLTPLIPKICFQRCGLFREDLRCVQDWDMWIRLMLNYRWGLLPEQLVQSRVHHTQTGVRLSKRCKCEQNYLQKYYLHDKTLYPKYFPQYTNTCMLNIAGTINVIYVRIFIRFKKICIGQLGKLLPERIKKPLRKLI